MAQKSKHTSKYKLPLKLKSKHYNSLLAGLISLIVIVVGYIAAQSFAATTPAIPRVYPVTSFWWQLEGKINANSLDFEKNPKKHYDFDFNYDMAGFASQKEMTTLISTLKSKNVLVTCYFEVGSALKVRDDFNKFQPADLGGAVDNWPDERWIDIRTANVRKIMADRMQVAKDEGCQGIEPDWLDNYTYSQKEYDSSGKVKPPTVAEELDYMRYLADTAHSKGMYIALKNVPDMADRKFADGKAVAEIYDWALSEECLTSYASDCSKYKSFIDRGKNVTVAEYNDQVSEAKFKSEYCPKLLAMNYDAYLFDRKNGSSPTLTGKVRIPCRSGDTETPPPATGTNPSTPTPTATPAPTTSPKPTATPVAATPTATPAPTATPKPTATPTPTPVTVPAVPSGVTSTLSFDWLQGKYVNRVQWKATDALATSFDVQRNNVSLGKTSAQSLSFSDYDLKPDTLYTYRVVGLNAAGASKSSVDYSTVIRCFWIFCYLQ